MKKIYIITSVLAFGAIGLGATISPVAAAPVSIVLDNPAMSENLNITKISGRRHVRRRHVRRRHVRRHRGSRRGYKRYGIGIYGVAAALDSTCSYYYRRAITTGARYWWVKYNHSCLQ